MPRRGFLTFVFDDGYASVYHHIIPLLNQRGFLGVFAVPLDSRTITRQTNQLTTPWSSWLKLKEQGHEIAAHSSSHADLTSLSPAELEQELAEPVRRLGATTCIYPGGAYDQNVLNAVRRHYHAGRTVRKGFAKNPPVDPFQLPTFNFTKHNFSAGKANSLALWAYLRNIWLIETYHLFDNNTLDLVHTVKTNSFIQHLNFVTRLPIKVTTIAALTYGP